MAGGPRSLADVLGLNAPTGADATEPDEPTRDFPALCREVISSRHWRDMIFRQISLNDLPPQISVKMMEYGWGKPVEQVSVTATVTYAHATPDDLRDKLTGLLAEVEAVADTAAAKAAAETARRILSEPVPEPLAPDDSDAGRKKTVH